MKKLEFEHIKGMVDCCCECGVTEKWQHGTARELGLCRECYRADDKDRCIYIDRFIDKQKTGQAKEFEWYGLTREYYRNKRELEGLFEPTITCHKCKKDKPIFEYRTIYRHIEKRSDLKRWVCIDCNYETKNTQRCPMCHEKKYDDEFEDNNYTYRYCKRCMIAYYKKQKEDYEKYLINVPDSVCITALKNGDVDVTPETMESKRNQLLAKRNLRHMKRNLKQLKARIKNESNCQHV